MLVAVSAVGQCTAGCDWNRGTTFAHLLSPSHALVPRRMELCEQVENTMYTVVDLYGRRPVTRGGTGQAFLTATSFPATETNAVLKWRRRLRHRGLSAVSVGSVALLALVSFGPGRALAQVGIGLAPMRVEVHVAPGGQTSGVLTLSSDSAKNVRVAAEPLDFYIDAGGTPQFEPAVPGEASYSCRNWLALNPIEMELDPNVQVLVRYTIRVPADAQDQSFHCAIGFTTQPTADQLRRMGIHTAIRAVAAIYVIVGGQHTAGALKSIRYEKTSGPNGDQYRAVVAIQNSGRFFFRPTGTLQVVTATGNVVETLDFVSLPVLPEREQNFVFPLKLVSGPGTYTLRVLVDLGTNEIQEGTAGLVVELPHP